MLENIVVDICQHTKPCYEPSQKGESLLVVIIVDVIIVANCVLRCV